MMQMKTFQGKDINIIQLHDKNKPQGVAFKISVSCQR